MDTRDKIIDATCDALTGTGVGGLTVGLVARRAKVSNALVHYHFSTKRRLLLAAARAVARRRTDVRFAAVEAGVGLAGVDALWSALARGPGAQVERAWPDLVLLSRDDAAVRSALAEEREHERSRLAGPLERLLASLGSQPRLPAEDLAAAVATFLDGAATALAAGAPADDVRASYDAFWLALVALGQAAPAR
jgi:AcrR family transcriptional regulator